MYDQRMEPEHKLYRASKISIVPTIKSSKFSIAESEIIEKSQDVGAVADESENELTIEASPESESVQPSSDTDSLIFQMTKSYKDERRTFRNIFMVINAIAFAMIALITYILIYWHHDENFHPDSSSSADYNIHLVVHVIGSLMLPGYGMVIFRAFPHVSYRALVNYHVAFNVIGLLMTAFGIKVAYDAHHIYASLHMYSLHSWFGFTIFILFSFQLVTGNWLYFRDYPQPIMKYCHVVAGSIIFIWSGTATISGLLYRASLLIKDKTMNQEIRITLNTFGVLANLFAILLRYLSTNYRFRRKPCPTEEARSKGKQLASKKGRAYSIVDNPFEQDTFEYGTVRKSIFVPSQTYEQFAKSMNAPRLAEAGGRLSEFYGSAIRRGTITRESISKDLEQLEIRRQSKSLPDLHSTDWRENRRMGHGSNGQTNSSTGTFSSFGSGYSNRFY